MNSERYNKELFQFIQASPSPFHAALTVKKKLLRNGFILLKESDAWSLSADQKYVVTRNDSCLIAFSLGKMPLETTGIRIIGAHTDSPCLKVKPEPEHFGDGITRLGVEVYGGALLGTWLDRGLNLAGRVTALARQDRGKEVLISLPINFDRPVASIPSLAIHFDREAAKGATVNPQVHCLPFWGNTTADTAVPFKKCLLDQVHQEHPDIAVDAILDFELCLVDHQAPFYTGVKNEFISCPRLDNLLSCHAGLESLLASDPANSCLLILADHEEVGSDSASGARGSFLKSVLSRLLPGPEQAAMAAARSFMISCDNAHAVHPSYRDKYDSTHLPKLNTGPVLKINASQRYASDSESAAFFRTLCLKAGVECQTFVMRSDIPCGSTIGPAISASTGIKTVDIGAPTLAMHSIREMTGNRDPYWLYKVLKQFLTLQSQPLLSLT